MDRGTRVALLAGTLVVLIAALGFQAVTAESPSYGIVDATDGAYPGETLVTVQSYGWFGEHNGRAFILSEDDEIVWEYDPPDSRVFDAEELENGNIMVSVATLVAPADCPDAHQGRSDHCVRNRVEEIDRTTDAVVWNYTWYDEFVQHHEVHDADRLPSGETAIADMGNDRAFIVDRDGEITWEWSAVEHLGPGSEFWRTHVPEDRRDEYRRAGPESDWTHMNDIDRLSDGTIQLSIRNFDVVVAVDRDTKDIVDVVGSPGETTVLYNQHNPNRIESANTLLVADSENDRVVEFDLDTETAVWAYHGPERGLQWPRDADRLPNGNTLIVDSRNFRVLEINETGSVVWQYSAEAERGIVYDADRLSVPEEPDDVPSAQWLEGSPNRSGGVLSTAVSWSRFVLPVWIGVAELLLILGSGVVGLGLVAEAALFVRDRRD